MATTVLPKPPSSSITLCTPRSVTPPFAAVPSSTSAVTRSNRRTTSLRAQFQPPQTAVFDQDPPPPLVAQERVALLNARLEGAVGRIAEVEIEKFMRRGCAAELSAVERNLVEETGKEIIKKFLERPVQYLNGDCCCRGLEQKLNDLEFLLQII